MEVISYILILAASLVITYLLKAYSLKVNMVDLPNHRSSHTIPTPRGGGLSIVITYLVSILIAVYFGNLLDGKSIYLILPSFLVALIGYWDDHGHVDAKWRLLIHFVSAMILLYGFGGLPKFNIGNIEVELWYFGYLLGVLAVIWILNLFNFMDGIDGIAGIEAVTVTLFAGLIINYIEPGAPLVFMHWLLAASVVGFLVFNFPPAKIFMGDAGSGFLGFTLAALIVISGHEYPNMIWAWLILLGVFIVDATYTVIMRILNGNSMFEPHRSHVYQITSRKYKSHLRVTLAVLVINAVWLAPIAFLVAISYLEGYLGLTIAYTPLLLLAMKYKAGRE